MSFLHLLFSGRFFPGEIEAVRMMKRSQEQLRCLSLSVFLLTVAAPVASEMECDSGVCREASWDSMTWYHSEFEADAAGDGAIRLTAVDRYELWLNGTRIGSDDDWTTMETYQISVDKGTNEILVLVTNEGMGNGSGLLVELETGAQRTGTKVGNRVDREGAWRWSGEDPDLAEVDWGKAPLVQSGTLDLTRIAGRTNLAVVPVAGYPGDVDIGTAEGGIALSSIDGRNLALGQPSSVLEANDGVLTSSWTPGANALNKHVSMDLREIRRVSGVRVITKAPSGRSGSYFINSLKGYSVQVSEDQFRWSEVAVLHGITEYEETSVRFEPALARYIRVVVAEIDGVSAPDVAEIEVYGEAYSTVGTFESEPLDLDEEGAKNIGRITWEADVPVGTSIALQFRTMVDGEWSAWTREYAYEDSNTFVEAPEPASRFQYRVRLSTSAEVVTPRFRSIAVESSADDLPAASASGRISPLSVEMGRDTTFTYDLDLEISGENSGVERLIIAVPGPATLDPVSPVDGLEGTGSEVVGAGITDRGLEIPFDPPLDEDVQLSIRIRAAMYTIAHSWRAQLLAPDSGNPQNVVEDVQGGGWLVSAPLVLGQVLIDARAEPAVFTPNGDGRNDHATIVFTLAKAEGAPVSVRVFSLGGSLVRELHAGPLSARRYDGSSQSPPGRWDGTDSRGNVVPPGVYLYELLVEADEGVERRAGTVGLVY